MNDMMKRELSDRDFGTLGEKRAAAYLKRKGYKILEKNYKNKYGEIDLIARQNEEIVFCEVKTRCRDPLVSGQYAVDRKKQFHILRTASRWLEDHAPDAPSRFDVIEIELDRERGKLLSVNHIESAFIQSESYARF